MQQSLPTADEAAETWLCELLMGHLHGHGTYANHCFWLIVYCRNLYNHQAI